jgi:hypothetical protein
MEKVFRIEFQNNMRVNVLVLLYFASLIADSNSDLFHRELPRRGTQATHQKSP